MFSWLNMVLTEAYSIPRAYIILFPLLTPMLSTHDPGLYPKTPPLILTFDDHAENFTQSPCTAVVAPALGANMLQ